MLTLSYMIKMPRVLMTFFGYFRTVIGMTSEYVDTETLYDAIIKIANKHCDKVKQLLMYDDGRLKSNYVIPINGTSVATSNAKNIVLKDGDFISVFPPVGGG